MITSSPVQTSVALSPFTNGSRVNGSCREFGRALRCR